MLDIKEIRLQREAIESKVRNKEPNTDFTAVIELDSSIRECKSEVEALKSKRNDVSKQVGTMKRNGEDATDIMAEMTSIREQISAIDNKLTDLEKSFNAELSCIPNIPMDDVKVAASPDDNVLLKMHGEKRKFSFPTKNHVELNDSLNLFDFAKGAKISGAGWPVYKAWGARLEWALINYMLSVHLKNNYTQWIPPLLVRPEMMFASGQLPKFAGQFYELKEELYLIPTAEVTLNGLHHGDILTEEEMPLRYVAYTPCFRREAGAAGSNERGLIRTHQFNKVEMFCFTKPEDSMEQFEAMVASAEEVLQGLEMHYRNMLLVTGDMSFSAARTVDIEVWLPGQDRYYEVSSVSNCTDYQARRSNIRFKRKGDKKNTFVHTLNGSGLATSRLMVGLLENNQNEDGSVNIPKVLRPYLGGLEKLTAE